MDKSIIRMKKLIRKGKAKCCVCGELAIGIREGKAVCSDHLATFTPGCTAANRVKAKKMLRKLA